MNLRNLGIVFSPTLAIPAPLFTLFLSEFDVSLFSDAQPIASRQPKVTDWLPRLLARSPPTARFRRRSRDGRCETDHAWRSGQRFAHRSGGGGFFLLPSEHDERRAPSGTPQLVDL
jgi:hypothetical protein